MSKFKQIAVQYTEDSPADLLPLYFSNVIRELNTLIHKGYTLKNLELEEHWDKEQLTYILHTSIRYNKGE